MEGVPMYSGGQCGGADEALGLFGGLHEGA